MAVISPDIENIQRFKVPPTPGEWDLINYFNDHLDDAYEVFFNLSLANYNLGRYWQFE